MKSTLLKTFALIFLLVASACVFAEHEADQDVTVNVDAPVVKEAAKKLNLGGLGNLLYKTQEKVHETVQKTTGVEVDHYYINICSGDECLPVDPFSLSH